MKRCSNSFIVREMQIKTILIYRFSSADWQEFTVLNSVVRVENKALHALLKGTTKKHDFCGGEFVNRFVQKPYIHIHHRTLIYLDAQIVPDLACENTFKLAPGSFWHASVTFRALSYFLSQDIQIISDRPCSKPRVRHFPKETWFFLWEFALRLYLQQYKNTSAEGHFVAALFVIIKYWKLSKWANIREVLENCICKKE